MRGHFRCIALVALTAGSLLSPPCSGQSPDGGNKLTAFDNSAPSTGGGSDLPRIGVAVGIGTLGVTIQGATAITPRSNLRLGFNVFNFSDNFDKDGISYDGTLDLRSVEVLYDQYLFGGLHISPGLMLYNGNKLGLAESVPGGQSFTLGGVTYFSNSSNPVNGTGGITMRKAAPMILIGFGNLLPRSSRRFTLNFDIGAVFQGQPKASLNLTGTACTAPGSGCVNAATDPGIQSNIQSEQNKLNKSVSFFKYYPVISLTFGYKF